MARASLQQKATCPFCHGPADVVPGESYKAEDVGLFDTIESVIHAAQLPRLSSHRLWVVLSNVPERGRRPDLLLLPVVDAMPSLQFVQQDFIHDRAQQARAAGMILAALTAHLRALEARQSASLTAT
ncbi:MAG TPA: hypothetical protein VJN18_02985 [Polyangiaceae bacterium]|nr:hypothetical protein [Polyangiaceae bacterium]